MEEHELAAPAGDAADYKKLDKGRKQSVVSTDDTENKSGLLQTADHCYVSLEAGTKRPW